MVELQAGAIARSSSITACSSPATQSCARRSSAWPCRRPHSSPRCLRILRAIVLSQDQDSANHFSVPFFMTTHQSVWSKLLGAWAPFADAANVGSPSRNARKGFLFRRDSEVGGTNERHQISYGTAALEQLKREFLKNAQVRELSSEEALQECLRAQVIPFWPAPTSGPSNRVAKPRRPRLLNVVQCWRRAEVELSCSSARTVYMGFSDPRTVEATVLGWLPFVDEIVLVKPSLRRLRSTKSGASEC